VADASWTRSSGPDDGWGPATSVWAAPPDATPPRGAHVPTPRTHAARRSGSADPYGPESGWDAQEPGQSARDRLEAVAAPTVRQRGLPGWLALLVLIGITVLGLLLDSVRGQQLGSGFNIGIIAGSVLAILLVRRSGMFPVVVAPPIVYALAAGVSLYVRSGGLDKRSVLIDAAANWLVYGFPAIAGATAAVLIIAGIRLIVRR
jgi:hypothetical protein